MYASKPYTFIYMSDPADITELLSEAFNMTRSEVRRKIKQNAFKVHAKDGDSTSESITITSPDFECSLDNLDEKIVQFGKRHFRLFRFDEKSNDWQIWG